MVSFIAMWDKHMQAHTFQCCNWCRSCMSLWKTSLHIIWIELNMYLIPADVESVLKLTPNLLHCTMLCRLKTVVGSSQTKISVFGSRILSWEIQTQKYERENGVKNKCVVHCVCSTRGILISTHVAHQLDMSWYVYMLKLDELEQAVRLIPHF